VHGLSSSVIRVLGVKDKGALAVTYVGGNAGGDVEAVECEVDVGRVVVVVVVGDVHACHLNVEVG
jgi:hypothetical protein